MSSPSLGSVALGRSRIQFTSQSQIDHIRNKVYESMPSSFQAHSAFSTPTPMSFQAFSSQTVDEKQRQIRNDIAFCMQGTRKFGIVASTFRALGGDLALFNDLIQMKVLEISNTVDQKIRLILTLFDCAVQMLPRDKAVSHIQGAFEEYPELISSLHSFQHETIDISNQLPIDIQTSWRQPQEIRAPYVVNFFPHVNSVKSIMDSVNLFVEFMVSELFDISSACLALLVKKLLIPDRLPPPHVYAHQMARRTTTTYASLPDDWICSVPQSVAALALLALKNMVRTDPSMKFGTKEEEFQPFWELVLNSFTMFAPCLFARCEKRYLREWKDVAYEDLTIWRHSVVDGKSQFQRQGLVELKMGFCEMISNLDLCQTALMGQKNTTSDAVGQILKLVSIYSCQGLFGIIETGEAVAFEEPRLLSPESESNAEVSMHQSSGTHAPSSASRISSGLVVAQIMRQRTGESAAKQAKHGEQAMHGVDLRPSKFLNACCKEFKLPVCGPYPTLDVPNADGCIPFLSLIGSMQNQVTLAGGSIKVNPHAIPEMRPRGELEQLWIAPAVELFGPMEKSASVYDFVRNIPCVPIQAGWTLIGQFISNLASVDFEKCVYLVDVKQLDQEKPRSRPYSAKVQVQDFHVQNDGSHTLWPFAQFDVIASGGHSIIAMPQSTLVDFSISPCIVKIAPDREIMGEWNAHQALDNLISSGENIALRRLCNSSGLLRVMTQDSQKALHQVTLRNPICRHSNTMMHISYRALLLEGVGSPIDVNSFDKNRVNQLYELCRSALLFMHSHGWAHCDIKPDNIIDMSGLGRTRRFLSSAEPVAQVSLVDFPSFMVNDIALATKLTYLAKPTQRGTRIGTPWYQVKRLDRAYGAVDDLCSLAITALHLAGCQLDPNPTVEALLELLLMIRQNISNWAISIPTLDQMLEDLQTALQLNEQAAASAVAAASQS